MVQYFGLIMCFASIFLIGQPRYTEGTSYVRPISEQWPWAQWTTTLAPGQVPTTYAPATTPAPPPEVTFLPQTEEEKKLIIITDPNTGQVLYVPAQVFWERFGGFGGTGIVPRPNTPRTVTPRNPFICDFYARNCWLPNQQPQGQPTRPPTPSRGGGGGSHIYGHPNFHQGIFPGPNEPPRDSGRTRPNNGGNGFPESPQVEVTTRRTFGPRTKTTTRRPFVSISDDSDQTFEDETTTATTTFRPFRPRPIPQPQPGQPGSRGGGGGAHIFGHPNFHQGAFPGPDEPPRSSGRTIRSTSTAENLNSNSFVPPSFGITSQTRTFFGAEEGSQAPSFQNYQPFQPSASNSKSVFESRDLENAVIVSSSNQDLPATPRQRFSGGTGIGGITCPEGSSGCLQKSNEYRRSGPSQFQQEQINDQVETTTLQAKIRVTRPAPDSDATSTTEISPDYSVDLKNE